MQNAAVHLSKPQEQGKILRGGYDEVVKVQAKKSNPTCGPGASLLLRGRLMSATLLLSLDVSASHTGCLISLSSVSSNSLNMGQMGGKKS